MQINPKKPTVKGSEAWFTGDVWVDPIATPQNERQRMVASLVRFSPGARTAWHSHEQGQTLHVMFGVALMGTRDGKIIEVTPGQTVYTPPGEEHWHGATPDDFMEHLALLENGDDPAHSAVWLEHVSDEDYHRP
jgi:quercetin dioxygenase-like cupin family protein